MASCVGPAVTVIVNPVKFKSLSSSESATVVPLPAARIFSISAMITGISGNLPLPVSPQAKRPEAACKI